MSELSEEEIKRRALEFLRENRWAVLATSTKDGQPYAATMNFFVDNDFTFYFISMEDTKKLSNLRENNRAAIVVGCGPYPITIQGEGVVEVKEGAEKDLFYKVSAFSSSEDLTRWPILRLSKDKFATVIFKPSWLSWLNLDEEKHPETYSLDFHKVI